jgi:hypothetical protein
MTVNRVALALILCAIPLCQVSGQKPKSESTAARRPIKKPSEIKFRHDSFTFVRIKYSTGGARRGQSSWATDYPDSDLNLTARVAADTGLQTDPKGKVLSLTDPELVRYPFIYIVEPGALEFTDDEVQSLRKYLLGGGFLLVDDFWGDQEWGNFKKQFERVFPHHPLKELPIEHPVFHCFYEFTDKPQVPSIHSFAAGRPEANAQPPNYWGVNDDKGRLMALICHNTDLGDGWERGDNDARYNREVSQRLAFPMGVNIVVYALTQGADGR